MTLFLKASLVDNFPNTFNFNNNWAVICSLLSAQVLSLSFITSEAVHSILKQVCHVKAEHECGIRLPQPCCLILKSFAVHKSSAADIVHLPVYPPAMCREEGMFRTKPYHFCLDFFVLFQHSPAAGGSCRLCQQMCPPVITLYLSVPLNQAEGSCNIRVKC